MRALTAPVSFALGSLLVLALASCSGSPTAGGADPGGPAPSGSAPGDGAVEEIDDEAAVADIREADLGNVSWLYSLGGTELPLTVQLVDGESFDGATAYLMEDVQYGDVDGDGDEDAVASISQANGNGYERLWYLWLVDGAEVAQLQYPIAQTSRCGTAVDAVVAGDGSVSVTQRQRLAVVDDAVPCSDAGTGLQVRTITVQREGELLWPVQTEPIPAWGGICPRSPWPDASPQMLNLFAAPSMDAAPAAFEGDSGAIFGLYPAPLMQRDGWTFIGFTQGNVDVGPVKLQCAWGAGIE